MWVGGVLAPLDGVPPETRPVVIASIAPHRRRYRVLRTLEKGASSEVVLAVSEGPFGFERTVVIKRLLPGFEVDAAVLRSLARDAMQYADLTHPAIVRMYDFFAVNGRPAMVLEYVEGRSLGRLLDPPAKRLPTPVALHVGARVFAALAAAHSARDVKTGLPDPALHRHVSPATVLITHAGDVKLFDFGFARLMGDTRGGFSIGTMGYMAPEQAVGKTVGPATDVYCAALLVRELLTGERAFPAGTLTRSEQLQRMARPRLAPLNDRGRDVPPAVTTALTAALHEDSDARRVTAEDMHAVLRAATDREVAQRALVDAMRGLAER